MRKGISMMLLLAVLISTTCPTAVFAKAPDVSINANRYYYRYEISAPIQINVTHISTQDVATTNNISTIVTGILGLIPVTMPSAHAAMIINMCMDMNAAGTLYTYKTVKERIQVDALTGQEKITDTWWIVETALYDTYGNYYNSQSQTIRIR